MGCRLGRRRRRQLQLRPSGSATRRTNLDKGLRGLGRQAHGAGDEPPAASDADGNALTYSKSGADASKFTINVATGALGFSTAPAYEHPTDADAREVASRVYRQSDGRAYVFSADAADTCTGWVEP